MGYPRFLLNNIDEYNPYIKDYQPPSPLKFNIDSFLPEFKVESSPKPMTDPDIFLLSTNKKL